MPCTYSFSVDRLGTIEVLEKRNARGMSIRVHEGGVVRVTVHPSTTQLEVGRYVVEQAEWIEAARQRMARKSVAVTIFTPDSTFATREHRLVMSATSRDKYAHVKVKQGLIEVTFPSDVDPSKSEVVQSLARKGIAFAFKVEGQKVLPQRLDELARIHGFTYSSVELKDMKSRWGSCSSKKGIQLNVQLMRLPDELIDHVLLHELCHTVEMNHGPRFHELLNKVDGGRAALHERQLKTYRTQRW